MKPLSSSQIEIRIAEESDLESILKLFKDCVLTVCREDYSQEQLNAWASAAANIQRWSDKIQLQYFVVAHVSKKLVGFGALENKDLIDLLYVHKDWQGSGVGSKILGSLISMARSQGINVLKAEVSKTARHFLRQRGLQLCWNSRNKLRGLFLIIIK